MNTCETDKYITELFFARDERAIEEFRRVYGRLCLSIARAVTGSDEDAEECLNDTYLRLWNSIPPERPESYRAYGGRIVRNLALNMVEKRNTAKRCAVITELDECFTGELPDEDNGELSAALNRFLGTLQPLNAKLFVRRYWYSEAVNEIAHKSGLTENAVTKRLAATRKKLKKFLIKEGISV